MAKFDTDGKHLYIDGKKVLHGWESFSGWYWFATEKAGKQMSDMADGIRCFPLAGRSGTLIKNPNERSPYLPS